MGEGRRDGEGKRGGEGEREGGPGGVARERERARARARTRQRERERERERNLALLRNDLVLGPLRDGLVKLGVRSLHVLYLTNGIVQLQGRRLFDAVGRGYICVYICVYTDR